jgi:iron(III) transport system permease protein
VLGLVCFLAVPLGVLGYWLGRSVAESGDLASTWHSAVSSLWISAAAACVAAVASLPVALLARRRPGRAAAMLERLAYTPNALPGIVVALSLVFFGARYGGFAYQTLGMLLFAYSVRFLPQALAGTGSALAMVDPKLEEAARGLGRSPLRAFLRITLPLASPGVAAGAALVALSTMKELPITLLLRPIGFETLATDVWKLTSVGDYSRAALPALALVALATPIIVVLTARRDPGALG